MKPLVIYHASCADGFGAAFAAWYKLGDEAEYLAMQYGQIKSAIDTDLIGNVVDRDVYILDFSLPKDVMQWLFETAKRVVWLDHHASVFKDWDIQMDVIGDNAYFSVEDTSHHVRLDNNKSGAMLAWEHFHPGTEVPMFIKHIDDYDRWQFKIEGTKAFQKALWSYAPWSFEQWKDMLLLVGFTGDEGEYNFYESGNAILRAHDQNVAKTVKEATMECCISTYTNDSYGASFEGLAANCPPHLTSDVGHELANQSGTFGLLWHIDKDGKCKCSLRSNGDYDVSAIAKAFGGGGHKNAAGFEIDIQTLLGWMA